MVVVGGKSVGDVVELLGDGRHFGLDLTYRYQPGALGIAHAIGLARDFVGSDAFCCVLGDNILRGAGRSRTSANEFEDGDVRAPARCSTASRIPERFGVAELDADGNVVGFEEKPAASEERPHPDRRLLPPARRLRGHRAASRRRVAASSRSPTCSTTTSRGRPVQPRLRGSLDRRRHRAVAAARRRVAAEDRRRRRLADPAAPARSADGP